MTGTVKTIEGEGSHHVIGHTPKHSVEVNVRIKRAKGDGYIPAPPISSSTPDPESARITNATLRRGSWAGILHRFKANAPTPIEQKKVTHNQAAVEEQPLDLSHHEKACDKGVGIAIGTQTDVDDQQRAGNSGKEDYIQTIHELHHLSLKLKADVNRARMAKEQMASNLLGIIEEKDRIIASFKAQPPLPGSTHSPPAEEPEANHSTVNRYRSLIRDMRSLCREEIEAMKQRRAAFPPFDPRLEKFLKSPSLNEGVNGGGDGGRVGNGMLDSSDPANGGAESDGVPPSSCSSSGSSRGAEKELDNNSTQYLDLPKQ